MSQYRVDGDIYKSTMLLSGCESAPSVVGVVFDTKDKATIYLSIITRKVFETTWGPHFKTWPDMPL